ncbi:hypothetical protein TWF173_011556 [Orbilia oligospora]|nr:hypothetical protein TWF173_011556 [Orbilia oligospora]
MVIRGARRSPAYIEFYPRETARTSAYAWLPLHKKKCVVGRVAKLHITARSEPGCILTEKKHGYLKSGTYDGWWGYISKCTGSTEEPNGKPLEFLKLSLSMPKRDTACKFVPVELADIKR